MIKKFLALVFICMVGSLIYYQYTTVHTEAPGGSPVRIADRGMDYEKAVEKLKVLVQGVGWTENFVQRKASVQLGQTRDLKTSLPEITQFGLVVNPPQSEHDEVVEIFTSTEKSGTGIDGIMVEMAQDFNAQNMKTRGGKAARVAIRKIASGTGYEFIAYGKYLPDAFSPSNHLWVRMVEAHGVAMTPVRELMVGNVAGVVMKKSVADRVKSAYGSLDVKNIIDAVVQGNLVMGYTDPFASSTGLNFLVTVLATFAGGNPDLMLSPEVVSSFESFQKGVPFVALTTLQMRESVQNDGSLEAFVMEYQTYVNTQVLKSGYEFIPFGGKHDNPLYAVGGIRAEKMEVLEMFASFVENPKYKKIADQYGFNPPIQYEPPFQTPAGTILVAAQKIWKEKKDAGRPVSAIFLCDISGSMRGTRLNNLKKALLAGSEFIDPQNAIGIVLFNHTVSYVLPINKFGLPHKSAFHAAVEDMSADGKTAMYDGVAVSLSLLVEEKKKNPDSRPMLFVLTDGETNKGLDFNTLSPVISGLNIPIYTIGYEANISELTRLSSLVEAASLNAGEGEIEYKIGALLNAQM
jgi:Ca-activated chloride channel family protein